MADQPGKTTHAQRRRKEAQDGARMKLRAGQYVRRLREIADKVEKVDPAQVPALRLKADIYTRLLSKCLPDLKAIEHTGEFTHRHERELSDAELVAIAASGSAGTADETSSPPQPAGIH